MASWPTADLPRSFNILRGVAFLLLSLAVWFFPCLSQSLPTMHISSAVTSFHTKNFSQLCMLHLFQGRTYFPLSPHQGRLLDKGLQTEQSKETTFLRNTARGKTQRNKTGTILYRFWYYLQNCILWHVLICEYSRHFSYQLWNGKRQRWHQEKIPVCLEPLWAFG